MEPDHDAVGLDGGVEGEDVEEEKGEEEEGKKREEKSRGQGGESPFGGLMLT